MATNSRKPSSGASRNGAGKNTARAAKRPQGAARKSKPAPARRRMPRGRLVLFFLLAGGLGYGLWLLSTRPSPPVEDVPSALSSLDEAPESETQAPPPSAKKPTERFEFYDILPNQRVLPSRTPNASGSARPKPKAPSEKPAAEPTSAATLSARWLQVGAFRDSTQATNRVAQLKSLNIPAQRQRGFDAQGKPLDRVVAGPFESARELTEVRARLSAEGLDTTPLSSLGDSQ